MGSDPWELLQERDEATSARADFRKSSDRDGPDLTLVILAPVTESHPEAEAGILLRSGVIVFYGLCTWAWRAPTLGALLSNARSHRSVGALYLLASVFSKKGHNKTGNIVAWPSDFTPSS